MLKDFKAFLLQGNLVTLAVAFVMGVAFAAVLNSFVTDMIMPLIAMIIGKPDFSALTFTINHSVFHWGAFLNAVITFVTIAARRVLLRREAVRGDHGTYEKPEEEAGPTNEERMVELLEKIAAK